MVEIRTQLVDAWARHSLLTEVVRLREPEETHTQPLMRSRTELQAAIDHLDQAIAAVRDALPETVTRSPLS